MVGTPGKWSTEVLADRLEEKSGFRAVVDMSDIVADVTKNQFFAGDLRLDQLDGIVVKKVGEHYNPTTEDRIHLLGYLEVCGVKIFSNPESIGKLINRLSGTLTLRANDIAMPATVITESVEEAVKAVRGFGSAVLKPLYSTKARGMLLLHAEVGDKELRSSVARYQESNPVMYIQQQIFSSGRDLGMVFVGGKYLCTYARVGNSESWNTTIHSGGSYTSFEPTPELVELGQRAQACFDLSFTTVDIAVTDRGPLVFEVSAFGGFKGALNGCGIDAAGAYTNFILEQMNVNAC